jgi:hypothetical protein
MGRDELPTHRVFACTRFAHRGSAPYARPMTWRRPRRNRRQFAEGFAVPGPNRVHAVLSGEPIGLRTYDRRNRK